MGTISFLLPTDITPEASAELERAGMVGGQDTMPFRTQINIGPGQLSITRPTDESGYLVAPWDVDGAGLLMVSSPTVIERPQPYQFQLELARGKVNQIRTQCADWVMGGLTMTPGLPEAIQKATKAFCRAVAQLPSLDAGKPAQESLGLAHRAAEDLVAAYVSQVFAVRHQRQSQLDTLLTCRVPAVPEAAMVQPLQETCNAVCVPLAWNEVEPAEADYRWGPHDALIDWARQNRMPVVAGPIIDFSPARLPDWVWLWEGDVTNLAGLMCDHVEAMVKRYRDRVRTWQITAGSNLPGILGLGEDELLWLTVRVVEAARQVDPYLDLVIGIAQPWGDYMSARDCNHSPFAFADTLIRSGLSLSAIDLELVMGVAPRGSYCRDVLDVSRLLDLYALLGVPLQATLGYPCAEGPDADADSELAVAAGHWRGAPSPQTQAEWAETFGALALCKPAVRAVQWAGWHDGARHQFPHCGLFNRDGTPRPAQQRLRDLRTAHLR